MTFIGLTRLGHRCYLSLERNVDVNFVLFVYCELKKLCHLLILHYKEKTNKELLLRNISRVSDRASLCT